MYRIGNSVLFCFYFSEPFDSPFWWTNSMVCSPCKWSNGWQENMDYAMEGWGADGRFLYSSSSSYNTAQVSRRRTKIIQTGNWVDQKEMWTKWFDLNKIWMQQTRKTDKKWAECESPCRRSIAPKTDPPSPNKCFSFVWVASTISNLLSFWSACWKDLVQLQELQNMMLVSQRGSSCWCVYGCTWKFDVTGHKMQ